MDTALQASDLITGVGILLGFQVTAFTWRVNRELQFRDKANVGDKVHNGSSPSDWLSLAAILLNASTIVALLLNAPAAIGLALFGVSLVLFATYPFAVLAHYRIFRRTEHVVGSQPVSTPAEWIIISVGLVVALIVGIMVGNGSCAV